MKEILENIIYNLDNLLASFEKTEKKSDNKLSISYEAHTDIHFSEYLKALEYIHNLVLPCVSKRNSPLVYGYDFEDGSISVSFCDSRNNFLVFLDAEGLDIF